MIETDRLLLRPFTAEDLDLIEKIYCDADTMWYVPAGTLTPEQAEEHLKRVVNAWEERPQKDYELAVITKEDGEKIGRCHIQRNFDTDTAMIGWFLVKEARGKGYATEITKRLIDCCFEDLQVPRINALCNPANTDSSHVLEKCGFALYGLYEKKMRYDRNGVITWEDEAEYELLREEHS